MLFLLIVKLINIEHRLAKNAIILIVEYYNIINKNSTTL